VGFDSAFEHWIEIGIVRESVVYLQNIQL
jgi:hypothetical protein